MFLACRADAGGDRRHRLHRARARAARCGRSASRSPPSAGARAKAARRSARAAPYDDLGELLERERVDVLHVCTPNDVHAEQALAAIERGVHVVCEKPLARLDRGERARWSRPPSERGLVHATCYHVARLSAGRADAGRASAAGALGEITFVHGRYLCDDVLFPASGWRMDPARSGPSYVVGDLGTHWLDLAEHVTGLHVTEVLADFRSLRRRAARGLRRAAAALRGRRAGLARALGRRRRPEEPAPVRVRGDEARAHLGPGGADRDALPPGDGPDADRRQGSR